MLEINLNGRTWEYDPDEPLGKEGGFGEVFIGTGKNGQVAVKRLKLSVAAAALRELKIAKNLIQRDFDYVVPIFDAGQDVISKRLFIVMPVCSESLQDKIKQETSLDLDEALGVMRNIISGLLEVKDIVHRDLKPDNILFHDGRWKVADFGIAKLVEDSTSLQTLRECLTPQFAAPEQWNFQRPTSKTDVYALGCIFYSLINGNSPFSQYHDVHDIRSAHLGKIPPEISAPPTLSSFISTMMKKNMETRPTLERCQEIFSKDHLETKSMKSGMRQFAKSVAVIERSNALAEVSRVQQVSEHKSKNAIFNESISDLNKIIETLFSRITSFSEDALLDENQQLRFGFAKFGLMVKPEMFSKGSTQNKALASQLNWDIVASTLLRLDNKKVNPIYTWAATLVYADLKKGEGHRWYEIAFFKSALTRGYLPNQPFALSPHSDDFNYALLPIMHTTDVAYGPTAIDIENEEDFIDRWLNLIGKAAIGELERPNSFPVRNFVS